MRNEFDCYSNWGFRENPFQPAPLNPDKRGEKLFVGRDKELRLVKARLHKHGKITCVEGAVGVGKTSLVNVAAFECLQSYLVGNNHQLLVPCRKAFQLETGDSVESFSQRVFVEIAQTLIEKAERIKGMSFDIAKRDELNKWLNAPQIQNIHAGLKWVLEVGTTVGANTSSGFSGSGFERLIRQWLEEIFPGYGSGGVVCIIDNLELLDTATKARKSLEALRDRLFNAPGIRWVFCGANGIVNSVISSPRLNGYLTKPVVEVESIDGSVLPELLSRRILEFAFEPGKEYLPIREQDFRRLYYIINFNLRDLLAQADEYCTHVFELEKRPDTEAEKEAAFDLWLERQTVDQYQDMKARVPSAAFEFLDTAMSERLKGRFGPGDFQFFKHNSFEVIKFETFMKHARGLENLGLITRWIDDAPEGEKKTIFDVTSKGAMVHYGRALSRETRTLATPWKVWGAEFVKGGPGR